MRFDITGAEILYYNTLEKLTVAMENVRARAKLFFCGSNRSNFAYQGPVPVFLSSTVLNWPKLGMFRVKGRRKKHGPTGKILP